MPISDNIYRLSDEEKDDALKLLEGVLAICSVNGESRETAVAEYLKEYFKGSGYCTAIEEIDSCHGNFIMDVPGRIQKSYVVWNGHMDTVPYGDISAWTFDPAKPAIRGEKIYCRGASDMKSGLCAMAFALKYLSVHGFKPNENIRFACTCDEEKGGLGAKALLHDDKFGTPDFLLIGEPTDCRIGIAQKGCIWLGLTLRGKTSHGAYPHMGINAAEAGFELCESIKSYISGLEHPVLGHATAVITQVSGGVAYNMVPDTAGFTMDIRTVPVTSHVEILTEIDRLSGRLIEKYPGLRIETEIINERIPIDLPQSHVRAEVLRSAVKDVCGYIPDDIGISFFTDASILVKDQAQRVPVLLFGPGDPDLCHKADEYMVLDNYYRAIEVYIRLLLS